MTAPGEDIVDVRRVDVQAGDTLVVRIAGNWPQPRLDDLRERLRDAFDPDIKILVMSDSITLEVVRPA